MESSRPQVAVRVLDPRLDGVDVGLPGYATAGSAGLDLRAMLNAPLHLAPNAVELVSTGLSVHISSPGLVGIIAPRSGLGHKKGIVLGNLVGVIDADYQGPLMVSLWNRSAETVVIEPLDRVAQLLVVPVVQIDLVRVDSFEQASQRGEGGFGHSGAR